MEECDRFRRWWAVSDLSNGRSIWLGSTAPLLCLEEDGGQRFAVLSRSCCFFPLCLHTFLFCWQWLLFFILLDLFIFKHQLGKMSEELLLAMQQEAADPPSNTHGHECCYDIYYNIGCTETPGHSNALSFKERKICKLGVVMAVNLSNTWVLVFIMCQFMEMVMIQQMCICASCVCVCV